MTSARSEACPQGLLGSGIRGLIRTSTAHGHVFLLQLNTNAGRRLTAAWRYCSSYIKALQLLLLSIYQSLKKKSSKCEISFKVFTSLQLYFTGPSNKSKDEKYTEKYLRKFAAALGPVVV